MALSCDFRILSESPKAVVGLPETSLGLLPGWGGCYRLPRLVGFLRALTIVVSGRPFRPAKAQKLGMVNEVVPRELVEPAAKDWLAKGKRSKRKFFLGNLRLRGLYLSLFLVCGLWFCGLWLDGLWLLFLPFLPQLAQH